MALYNNLSDHLEKNLQPQIVPELLGNDENVGKMEIVTTPDSFSSMETNDIPDAIEIEMLNDEEYDDEVFLPADAAKDNSDNRDLPDTDKANEQPEKSASQLWQEIYDMSDNICDEQAPVANTVLTQEHEELQTRKDITKSSRFSTLFRMERSKDKYRAPKTMAVAPEEDNNTYDWTPAQSQATNWRKRNNGSIGHTSDQKTIKKTTYGDRKAKWLAQESMPAHKRLPKANEDTIRFKNMSRGNKQELEDALNSGSWQKIRNALEKLERNKECMTTFLSKRLSNWIEYQVYRGLLAREHTSKKFDIHLWPMSARTSRSIATLADPEQLLEYLNFPSITFMMNGVSAELIWCRIPKTERQRMMRKAFGVGAHLSKRYR